MGRWSFRNNVRKTYRAAGPLTRRDSAGGARCDPRSRRGCTCRPGPCHRARLAARCGCIRRRRAAAAAARSPTARSTARRAARAVAPRAQLVARAGSVPRNSSSCTGHETHRSEARKPSAPAVTDRTTTASATTNPRPAGTATRVPCASGETSRSEASCGVVIALDVLPRRGAPAQDRSSAAGARPPPAIDLESIGFDDDAR